MQKKTRVFTVRMLGALEMKSAKSAKPGRQQLLRRQRIHFVENTHRLEYDSADDPQALRAELVSGVLRRVPKDVVIPVGEIDQVNRGHTHVHEWKVVILHG